MRTKLGQLQRRGVARDDDRVQNIWLIRQEPVDGRMHRLRVAEVVVIVEHDDQRLVYVVQSFVDQRVHGAFWALPDLCRRLPQIGERGLAEIRDELLDTICNVAEED